MASMAIIAGVSLVPPCRQATGPECLPQSDIIFLSTSLLQISTRIPYNTIFCASVSSQLVGKCQDTDVSPTFCT